MKFRDPRRFFDPQEGVAQSFVVPWTANEFQEMMIPDFANDPFTVVMQGEDRKYLCSMEVTGHGEIRHKAGAWEEVAPLMGLRHEYAQSRDALEFMENYARMEVGDSFESFLLSKDKLMEVPLFPPFEPEYVNEDGHAPKYSSSLLRQDYKKIVDWLGATVPNQKDIPEDKLFHAWSLTPSMQDEPKKPVFLGRSSQPLERPCVWLEFNPLTASGASMVVAADDGPTSIDGQYEWYGTKREFKYHAHGNRANTFVIHADEWHERINSVSTTLLAFDLVANYDFWCFGIRERSTHINRASRHYVRELVLPYTFRIVDPDPMDRPYNVRSVARVWKAGSSVEELGKELEKWQTERPGLNHTTLGPGEAYVMYPGSSLAHRVNMRYAVRVEGKFVRIVPDLTNDKEHQFNLVQFRYGGKVMGVFSKSVWPGSPFKVGFEECPAIAFKYQCGVSNAIEFVIAGKIYFIFRGIFRPTQLPQAYLKAKEKKDAQLPLFGFYVNPDQNTIYVDASMLKTPQDAEMCPAFTTAIPHMGTYMSRYEVLATRGLPVTDYMHAMALVGEARSVRSRLDMHPVYTDELTPTVYNTLALEDDDLYAQL